MGDQDNEEVRTASQYVLDLRNQVEETCKTAEREPETHISQAKWGLQGFVSLVSTVKKTLNCRKTTTTKCHLLYAQQEPYKKAQLLMKTVGEKSQENGPLAEK